MATEDITSALITYGLISAPNRAELDTWFASLFADIKGGGGGNLLASSVVGRNFTFGEGVTVQQAFNSCARAIQVLDGRAARKTFGRF